MICWESHFYRHAECLVAQISMTRQWPRKKFNGIDTKTLSISRIIFFWTSGQMDWSAISKSIYFLLMNAEIYRGLWWMATQQFVQKYKVESEVERAGNTNWSGWLSTGDQGVITVSLPLERKREREIQRETFQDPWYSQKRLKDFLNHFLCRSALPPHKWPRLKVALCG